MNRTNERTPRAKRSAIQERLLNADWQDLADRSAPLPEGVTPEMVLQHFGRLMLMDYDNKFGAARRGF